MILGDNVYKMILGVILQTWSARQLYMGCVVSMDMICNVGDCYMDVLERIEIISNNPHDLVIVCLYLVPIDQQSIISKSYGFSIVTLYIVNGGASLEMPK